MSEQKIIFSLQDVMASLAFEARKIVSSVEMHAAGYPPPDAHKVQQVINRMNELNVQLLLAASANETSVTASGQIGCALSN